MILAKKSILKMNKYLLLLKKLIRIALYISILSVVISCALMLINGKSNYGNNNDFTTTFVWYSIMLTGWTLFLSFIGLVIISVYLIKKKIKVLEYLSKEIINLLIGLFSLLILALIINIQIS